MTKKEAKFVELVKSNCSAFGVKCVLKDVKYLKISNSIRCSGYFDDGDSVNPVLAVATNRKDWLEILVHEYCHFTQWIDQIPLWEKAATSLYYVDKWLEGNSVRNIQKHIGVARDLELDNEKRSVEMIKQHNLNIDVDHYIRKANAYVQFYNYLGKSRRWCKPGNSPYTNERVIAAMPNNFRMRYSKLSKKVEKLFINENI